MTCYHPIAGFRTTTGVVFSERGGDILGDIKLACGRCIGCRMDRAQEWSTRCMHEASLWKHNCFVTLTYGEGKLPPNGSLEHRDFQLFLKRTRKSFDSMVRYYMCGEYGPTNGRPHYHSCFFGLDFLDRVYFKKSKSGFKMYRSPTLEKLWGHGWCTVQDLTPETASYCTRYIMKKQLGHNSENAYDLVDEDGVIIKRKPEYSAMSLKPGIGSYWFSVYGRDAHSKDYVVQDGRKVPVPSYYDELQDRPWRRGLEQLQHERQLRALDQVEDCTPERLAVREAVHLAKVRSLVRGDCNDVQE